MFLTDLALSCQFWTSVEMAHVAHKAALGCGLAFILEMNVEVLVIELLATVQGAVHLFAGNDVVVAEMFYRLVFVVVKCCAEVDAARF